MKSHLILGIFTAVCISNAVSQLDPSIKQEIDDFIQDEYFTKGRISAIGLAIVKDGEVLYTNGYGYRDRENSIPADSSTLFFIGSISKSFTATMAVKLLSEKFPELGEAVLDTPIRKLVPSFNFTLSDRYRSEQATFRDLLSHRVGEELQNVNIGFYTVEDPKELVYRQRYSKEEFPFRTTFLYSNGHYATAGELLAEIAGVPYLTLLDEFFSELEMTNSTYCKSTDDHDNMPKRAVGYYWKDKKLNRFNSEYYKMVLPFMAAGGILSDANDMAKYALFHLNSGRVGQKQVISEEAMSWLYKNSNPFRVPNAWKTEPDQREYLAIGYGLGFTLSSYDGWEVNEHNGYLPPFGSQLSIFPGTNFSVFLTASSTGALDEYTPSHSPVYKRIFDIVMGQASSTVLPNHSFSEMIERGRFSVGNKDTVGNDNHKPSVYESIAKSGTILQSGDILGHYGNGLLGELDIVERHNSTGQLQPYMILGKWGTGFLNQISSNEYAWLIDSDYIQTYYAGGVYGELVLKVTYDGSSMLELNESGLISVFEKGQVVGNLPEQPWSSDSCGPQET